MTNAGLTIPSGSLNIRASRLFTNDGWLLGAAVSILLTDPGHAVFRRRGLVAWGGLDLSGNALPVDGQLVADLPSRPWVGRFWHPTDEVPAPTEDAVISIVPVTGVLEAWEGLLGLVELEHQLVTHN